MDEIVRMPRKELERQQERVRKLALEKSYLQLVNDLMNGLSAMPGLENTVEAIVRLILNAIDGANVSLYYVVNVEIHSCDVYGHRRTMAEADDEMVKQVFESGQFVEEEREFKDTKMLTPEFTKASYWALPLKFGEQIIGVLKIDGMLMAAAEVRSHLQPFFMYVALVLKNEIENYSKLKEAYAQLQKTNNDLSGAQDALRNAYAEMEARVIERTMDLQNANPLLTAELAERKRVEEDLRRLNRELRAISNCNQALIRATDEDTLLHDICRIVCEEAGYRMAWVGYAEHDEAKTIRPMAWAGVEEGYLANARITWADAERGRGPTGTTVRTGKINAIQDFTVDPEAALWREAALERGYRSSIALPLKDENEITFGALNIYSTTPHAFTPSEFRLLGELADDLAFGIMVLRARMQRKQTQEALHKTNESLRATLEAAPVAIFDLDLDGHVKSIWNAAAERLLGWRRDEVIGHYLPTVPQEGKTEFAKFRELIRAGNTIMGKDVVRRRKDGSPVEYSLYAAPEYNDKGQVIGNIAALVDISVRKKAEDALKASEGRFRRLTENARDFIFRMSLPGGRYEYVSPAVEKLFGFTQEELYATPQLIFEIVHPDWREYLDEQWAKLLRGEMPPEYEFAILNKSGEARWVNQRNILVRDENGRIIALEGIVTDITERKKAEEQVRKLNEQLEERVTQRTIELELKNQELDRMNKLFVGRELRMAELKERIKELESALNIRGPRST